MLFRDVEASHDYYRQLAIQVIVEVRIAIASSPAYNIERGENAHFRGLCDQVSGMFISYYRDCMSEKCPNVKFCARVIHGELAHNSLVLSKNWHLEHTWVHVLFEDGFQLYVDGTCEQFYEESHIKASHIVSTEPIPYYIPDSKNFRWALEEKHPKWAHLYAHLQYHIWGPISDLLYYIRRWFKHDA